ncbi:MAG: hypothetical protein D6798_17480 [Deltaproteobacteria bacterium]|nr:MAG: hypothetical protein D6798_17480 [Deltaproteobacteria bacterium]
MLASLALGLSSPAAADTMDDPLWQAARQVRSDLAAPLLDAPVRPAYQELVADALGLARGTAGTLVDADDLAARAAGMGLVFIEKEDRFELYPASPSLAAAGVLAIRKGSLPAEVILAAPHAMDELNTGPIASALFEVAPFRALYLPTQSRFAWKESDAAHNEESALQLATAAAVEELPDTWFVQLHGFGPTTADAGVVVSGGAADTPVSMLERMADAICVSLRDIDVRTSRTVPQLAALSNVQSQLVRGKARFVHLALAADVREHLRADPGRLAAVGSALIEVALAPEPAPWAWFMGR